MTLKEKVLKLPTNPGVYIMKNALGEIIYVGKAKNLKNRVSSYFNNSYKNEKTLAMVSKVVDFDYIIVPSETDALALECNLIKKHQPHYNILLKDGKQFAYIKILTNETYPRVEITRKIKDKNAKYFGPYFNGLNATELLEIIESAFKLRKCKLNLPAKKSLKPCLNFHMGKCLAPCKGECKVEYDNEVKEVIKFLNGKTDYVEKLLINRMQALSETENFEEALKVRENLKMLKKLEGKITNILTTKISADIFAVSQNEEFSIASFLTVREGKVLGVNNFNLLKYDESNFETFIMQLYLTNGLNTKKIIVPSGVEISEAASNLLYERFGIKPTFSYPKTSDEKKMFKEAKANADLFLERNIDEMRLKLAKTEGAMIALKQNLGLKNLPFRCECYDISNTQGTNSVASMVVFEGGEPKKSDYRKFKIKTVKGISDFDSLKEVIDRRLTELEKGTDASFSKVPNVLIIDGGKGQLSSCVSILEKRGYMGKIEIISLAKRIEEVFLPYESESIILSHTSLALRMLVAIRNEAHRFAITFHRELRAKAMRESALDNIKGVGNTIKKALLAKFKTVNKIKNASIEELSKVSGVSEKLAQTILQELNK